MDETKPVQGTEERTSALVHEAVQRGAEKLQSYDLTGGVSAVGRALHRAADSLHDDGYDSLATATDRVGDRLYGLSDSVKGKSPGDIAREAQRFAHENPTAFIAGCALLGFAVARFLTTSSQPEEPEHVEYEAVETTEPSIPVAPTTYGEPLPSFPTGGGTR